MSQRYINPVPQYFDSVGDLLVEGFLLFEESGTNTKKPIWKDANLSTPHSNPVKLDGAGRCPALFTQGSYKVTAYKNNGLGGIGEQQWTRDPVGGEAGAFGGDWDATSIYGLEDIVRGSDDEYYQSLTASNQNNDPTTTPSAWSQLVWFHVWNTNETYAVNDLARGSNGVIYRSVVGSNLGNDPVSDSGTNWLPGGVTASSQSQYDARTVSNSFVTPSVVRGALIDVQVFTSNGTWTQPDGTQSIEVFVVGGGGGGGTAIAGSGFMSGGGGGGGGFAYSYISSGFGSSETVTVGAGGAAGGTSSPGTGSSGGSSSFGSHVSATGGSGGNFSGTGLTYTESSGGNGGDGTVTTGVGFTIGGERGSPSYGSNGVGTAGLHWMIAGGGGSSGFIGASTTNEANLTTSIDSVGAISSTNKPGSGGGGAVAAIASAESGDAGVAGIVIVKSYS